MRDEVEADLCDRVEIFRDMPGTESEAEPVMRGHHVERVKVNSGGYQGILIDPATGMLHGGSEHRKDGAAVGY